MAEWQTFGLNGVYKYPEHSGFYWVKTKEGEELKAFYDGRFFKDMNYDVISTLTITAWRTRMTPPNKDQIVAAANDFPEPIDGAENEYISGDLYHYFKQHADVVKAVLQSALDAGGDAWEWKEVTEELTYGDYLVTNNIKARDNTGKMSHVNHTHMVHKASEAKYGPFTAFYGMNDARIWGVTHYIDLSPATKPRAALTQPSTTGAGE